MLKGVSPLAIRGHRFVGAFVVDLPVWSCANNDYEIDFPKEMFAIVARTLKLTRLNLHCGRVGGWVDGPGAQT
jgi:hypothetical protein